MADFLERMAEGSRRRASAARNRAGASSLEARAAEAPPCRALHLARARFDVFAEIKRRSPSAAVPARLPDTPLVPRARAYEAAGAAAISVLTEPEAFGGSLDDLREVASAVTLPVLRKDFLVDPYQILEARTAGASGVLLILRLLDAARLTELLDAASKTGLFVLLEAFDAADLDRARDVVGAAGGGGVELLIGLNCRNLATLAVERERFSALRARVPAGVPSVAESGMDTPAQVGDAAAQGYDVALVGSALMRAHDPAALVASMLREGRARRSTSCACE